MVDKTKSEIRDNIKLCVIIVRLNGHSQGHHIMHSIKLKQTPEMYLMYFIFEIYIIYQQFMRRVNHFPPSPDYFAVILFQL